MNSTSNKEVKKLLNSMKVGETVSLTADSDILVFKEGSTVNIEKGQAGRFYATGFHEKHKKIERHLTFASTIDLCYKLPETNDSIFIKSLYN